ncbi:EamA family transporter [Candidatus Woesebacteria bacterium]|nr:EamA family transporter [Candidatus Woesebacteria bacterium]
MNWLSYTLLSAFFAAVTAILAKVGVRNVDSNLATAVRTVVVLLFVWGIVFFQGTQKSAAQISRFSLTFLVLSGIATGLSWVFYFKALQIGEASRVAPIDRLSLILTIILAALFLKEKLSAPVIFGSILMTLGAILVGLGK